MSIRTRLTLWYVGLLAVLLIVFGVALYTTVYITSYQEVDRSLQQRATDIQASLATAITLQDDFSALLRRGDLRVPDADVFSNGDIYVQLRALNGNVFSRSQNLGNQYLVVPSEQHARA